MDQGDHHRRDPGGAHRARCWPGTSWSPRPTLPWALTADAFATVAVPDVEPVAVQSITARMTEIGGAADVVLLDLRLEDGTDAAGNVAELRRHGVRVLVISVHGERSHVRATMRAGAGGYTLAETARRMGVTIPTVRSYLTRIRAKWSAVDEPVDDVRTLISEYRPPTDPR